MISLYYQMYFVSIALSRGEILLQFDVVSELFFNSRIGEESSFQHRGLGEA